MKFRGDVTKVERQWGMLALGAFLALAAYLRFFLDPDVDVEGSDRYWLWVVGFLVTGGSLEVALVGLARESQNGKRVRTVVAVVIVGLVLIFGVVYLWGWLGIRQSGWFS